MKKGILLLLAMLVICLVPMTVLAAEPGKLDAPIISNLRQGEEDFEGNLYYDLKWPNSIKNAIAYYEANDVFEPMYIITELNVNGKGWQEGYTANASSLDEGERCSSWDPNFDMSQDHIQLRILLCDTNGAYQSSPYSNIIEVNAAPYQASSWAMSELDQAQELGLIPDVLKDADLTKSITRAEFAAVAVKAYEALAGTKAIPNAVNPFKDTKDVEVLKAFNLGITTGTSDTTFDPNTLLNREQAATMLTRTFKRASMNGWTISTDSNFPLTYTKPALFADDSKISGWAKDSVYFMAANGIINGVGENKFAPQNTTSDEQARGYANATREQAIIIATRMVKNLDK